jgi:ABC-type uncharacterized transport system substrate-binding protein
MLRILFLVAFMLSALLAPVSSTQAGEPNKDSVAPTTNKGKKWRMGYVEGGPYQDYQAVLKALVDGLVEIGWIEKRSSPQPLDEQETLTLWSWLASEVPSDYLEFVADGYWSAGWEEEVREKNREAIIGRLNDKKDIDLMLAFGTKAGLDMANDLHSAPTMVLSCSDAIRAGIVKSAEDPGYDHIHAKVDPGRYERQIRLFHEIVKFKKLGIAYENTTTGRTYAAIEDVKKAAADLGFEVLECHTLDEVKSIRESEESVVECCQRLAPQVEAFYLTTQNGVNPKNLPRMLEPLFRYKVVTFSQSTTKEVKYGITMSLAPENYQNLGRFYARTMANILNGAKPRHLPQVFENTQQIAINLEAAKRIRFRIPLDVLAGAQEIYERIEKVDDAN